MGTGPVQVQAVCEAVLGELAGAFPTTQVTGSLAQWAGALGSLQQVIDTASAVQDAVIARLAAIEPVVLEDGTIVESHRALGHAALDTPAIVSGVLNVAPTHAEARVRAAVALAADGPAGTGTATGLGGLHAAMAAGRLDTYRASVVAAELVEAPPEVAATVVAALEGHFGSEDAAHLRRRCRRVLTRISPDLLVQRARRARQECGLRRWADEPGVDKWVGTFPSEDAAAAWAAIDALAHQYRTQGACPTIERARAKALTDLVAGNATIDTILTLTIPATALPDTVAPEPVTRDAVVPDGGGRGPGETLRDGPPAGGQSPAIQDAPADVPGIGEGELGEDIRAVEAGPTSEGDLVEVTGPNGAQPVYVTRSWLTTTIEQANTTGKNAVQVAVCHPTTGALLDDTATTTTSARGTRGGAATWPSQSPGPGDPPVDHRDGAAQPMGDGGDSHDEPGRCDQDNRDRDGAARDSKARDEARRGGHAEAGRGDNDEPMRVERGDGSHDRGSGTTDASRRSAFGASADRAGPYRPTRRMATRIKTRDRRCRFPGCTISTVFCDIDHVRPWPHGPTHDTNLLSLCRRHHRIKQRLRWTVALTPDGIATWTDPTGRVRTTHPANALHTSVLPAVTRAPSTPSTAKTAVNAGTRTTGPRARTPSEPAATSTSRARTLFPDGPHSTLEFHLEHHSAPPPGHTPAPVTAWRDRHGRHRAEILPIRGLTLLQPTPHPTHVDADTTDIDATGHWPCRRTRHQPRPHDNGPPPF